MTRILFAALVLAAAVPAATAQQAGAAADKTIVASINGENLTKARFDELWSRVPPHLQKQYDLVGGKPMFLNNYVRKRLLLQHGFRNGFAPEAAKKPRLDPDEESALFNRYVREVVASSVVTEEMVRQQYDENRAQFAHPDQVKLRHILIKTADRPAEEAEKPL